MDEDKESFPSKAHRLAHEHRIKAREETVERQAIKLRKIAHKKADQRRKGWPEDKSPI